MAEAFTHQVEVVVGGEAMRHAADLLHRFNREYDDPSPGVDALTERLQQLVDNGDTVVLLCGTPPAGVAVLRLRPAIWSQGLECYLAELYVVPDQRGRGMGRALLDRAMHVAREEGADTMDLGRAPQTSQLVGCTRAWASPTSKALTERRCSITSGSCELAQPAAAQTPTATCPARHSPELQQPGPS